MLESLHRFNKLFFSVIFFFSSYMVISANVIEKYEESIHLDVSGSMTIQVIAKITKSDSDFIRLPIQFTNAKVISIKAKLLNGNDTNAEIPVNYVIEDGIVVVEANVLEKGWKHVELDIQCSVEQYNNFKEGKPGEFGIYKWSHRFTNVTEFTLMDYTLRLTLPEGYNFNNVTQSIPEYTKEMPKPPYSFETTDKFHRVILKAQNIPFGGSAFLSVLFKSEEKSSWILIGGITLALLYLIFFKDLWHKSKQVTKS